LSKEILPCFAGIHAEPFEFGDCKVAFHDLLTQNRIFEPQAVHNFQSVPFKSYTNDYQALKADIFEYKNLGYSVFALINEEIKRQSFVKWLKDNFLDSGVTVVNCGLEYGTQFVQGKKVFLGLYDLFKKNSGKKIKRSKQAVFTQPEVGDFVVHSVHGIGVYDGIQKHTFVEGVARDYIIIKYKDNDTLYVPVESMDNLSKYVSQNKPTLNKLGGAEFAKVKAKVKIGVKKLAFDLVKLYAQRQNIVGISFVADETLYR